LSKTKVDHASSANGDAPRLRLDFLTSAPDLASCPADNAPEVAFAGRSNAGKSSVLNRLSGNRQTAKVSKTPGRTQLLNFFSIKEADGSPKEADGSFKEADGSPKEADGSPKEADGSPKEADGSPKEADGVAEENADARGNGRLVDLPGYGYAKAGRAEQARWQAAVNEYLSYRDNLVALVLVMDIRHPLQAYDLEIIDWATASELPLLILLNKADKLKYGARQRTLQMVRSRLSNSPLIRVITFSAATGLNLLELLDFLTTRIASDKPDQ
jgi:GTP-binding protein